MKKSFFTGLVLVSAFLAGCGGSLSDAEKASAGEAVSALNSDATNPTGRSIRAAAREVFEKAHTRTSGCVAASGSTSHGFTYALTCPDSNTYKITLTSTTEIDRTCGSDTLKITNVNATVTYSVTSATFSIAATIAATVNSEALSCNFSASVANGAETVSGDGYSCTYNGNSLSASDLQAHVCST